jgi:hypothetical protein
VTDEERERIVKEAYEREFAMKDSGERRKFPSGAVRDRAKGKPRPDLISPFMLLRVGRWLAMGAEKYEARNWEKGIPLSDCWASLCRHQAKYAAGEQDEDHLAALIANAMFIMHFQETGRTDLDDMPKYIWPEKSATPEEIRAQRHMAACLNQAEAMTMTGGGSALNYAPSNGLRT